MRFRQALDPISKPLKPDDPGDETIFGHRDRVAVVTRRRLVSVTGERSHSLADFRSYRVVIICTHTLSRDLDTTPLSPDSALKPFTSEPFTIETVHH